MSASTERWSLYQRPPAFVLGFHGCDKSIGEAILQGKRKHLTPSSNNYDWLGPGIYFWESNPQRALEFALKARGTPVLTKGTITKPFVIGAVIDLGFCLNLLDSHALEQVEDAHALFKSSLSEGEKIPENHKAGARFLDCAVIQTLHAYREDNRLAPYDSVRGMFVEGEELYDGAGFRRDDHIQLCVTNTACIRGYFRPIET
jgi:hypothetical protein